MKNTTKQERKEMKKNHLHLEDALNETIEEMIADIKDFIRLGWERGEAIDYMKKRSCLGRKSWAKVLEGLN